MVMPSLFSKRSQTPPARFREDFPPEVRSRVLHILQASMTKAGHDEFGSMLTEVAPLLLKQYGRLWASGYEAARMSDDPVIEHFFRCPDPMVLDFLQLCFPTLAYFRSGCRNSVVEEINNVFREWGIRFELTPFVETETERPGRIFGFPAGKEIDVQYPKAIVKDDEYLHQKAVAPCLEILRHERFRVANEELLRAEEHYRAGNYDDAITNAGKAFETVLKTICDEKGWPYNKDKDTAAKLVDICRERNLFPGFYVPIFEAAATVRNKLGAHGKGPTPLYAVERHHVEHAMHVTCSHILFLIRLAGLEN
jgi:hypothetical protein